MHDVVAMQALQCFAELTHDIPDTLFFDRLPPLFALVDELL
jgi:hypothetical protein